MMHFKFRNLAVIALLAAGIGGVALPAAANPFAGGDAAEGKKLYQAKCAACHNTMFPDKDGTQLYSDLFRKSQTPAAVKSMVTMCANRSGAGWFDEEILHTARYLNDTYYKFK